jgi:chondroitin sulfate synthase
LEYILLTKASFLVYLYRLLVLKFLNFVQFELSPFVNEVLSDIKRGINKPLKHALEDNINQVLQIMNKNARQKGRTIDYKDLWYGYRRVSPLYGADYVLDLLLTYRKHKGRKMTVPVRRHAYLHQTFGEVEFIEDPITAATGVV